MRSLPSLTRLVTATTGALLVPWLLVATIVHTSPSRQEQTRSARLVCDPRVPSRRALARVAFPSATRHTVLRDVAALLKRNHAKALSESDDDAIQNDPSAVGVEEGRQMPTAFEPLGILVSSHSSPRSHRTFSRRSPRGPPSFI